MNFNQFSTIIKNLNPKHLRLFSFSIVLMIINYLLEILGIGMIIPLIYFFLDLAPDNLSNHNILFQNIVVYFKDFNITQISLLLIFIFIFKNLFNIFFQYFILWNSVNIRNEISTNIYKKYLSQDIEFFTKRNSSIFLRNIGSIQNISIILYNYLNFFFEILVFISLIVILVLTFGYNLTIYTSLFLILVILILNKYSKKSLFTIANRDLKYQAELNKLVLENVSNIKLIKSSENENSFINYFKKIDFKIANNTLKSDIITQLPRGIIEISIILLIATTIIFNFQELSNKKIFISNIGIALVVIARLMPSSTRIIAAIQRIKIFEPSLKIINKEDKLNLTNFGKVKRKKIKFKELQIKNLSFKYNKKIIFKNLNLKIKKNNVIGIIGTNGSGKSTLVNLLMGLLKLNKGQITFNGNSYKNVRPDFGYLPQNINLIDDSIKNNVLFSSEFTKYNEHLYLLALKNSSLKSFVESLPKKDLTHVGEKGARISGGQLQKIGIARCFYNNNDIIILDEFDNNLDEKSKSNILKSIRKLKNSKTIILITHDKKIKKFCDELYLINKKKLHKIK